MLKIVTIIGARPQIIKAAALSRSIRERFSAQISEVIVHTGQHYDENMSNVFFSEMNIPTPHHQLDVRSGSHGKQTAAMIAGIEEILLHEKPDALVVYGDTNSTLAGAVAASKMHIPVVHIEAGLRSFNKQMPEEINRILCDHVSTLLFTPTDSGMKNLLNEGFKAEHPAGTKIDADHPQIYHSGDVMYDNSLYFAELAESKNILKNLQLSKGDFLLATIHRDYNTDHKERLSAIFDALDIIARSENKAIVLPLHPRTAKLLETNLYANVLSSLRSNPLLKIIPPVSFLEMIALEKHASVILTDSGGVQKEAFFFQRPCIILRSETEWVELVENGNAIITDADTERILKAYNHFKEHTKLAFPAFYGDGRAADFICGEMIRHFAN